MKNLGKIKAIIISACLSLVLVVGLVLTFVPMSFGNKDYESFIGSMNLSRGISNGISAEYTIDGEYSDKEISNAIKTMADITSDYGFKSVSIYKKGDNKIRLDINSTVLESDRTSAEDFLTTLASGKLELKNVDKTNADPETDIIIDGYKHIESIEKINYKTSSGLIIKFNKEGKELYSAATGSPLYMYVGGNAWPGSNSQNQVPANTDPSSTDLYLMFNSADVVDSYYYVLRAGTLPISLESDSVDVVYTTSKTANLSRILLFVLTLVVLVLTCALLIVRFKGYGIAASVASLFALIVEAFLLQAMNWVVIGASSIISIIFMILVNYASVTMILNKIKEEYAIGKTMETATEDGFKKTLKPTLLIYGGLMVVGLVLSIIGKVELRAIGTIFALGSVLFALTTILLTRLIINLFYSMFNNKPSFFGLNKREEA